MRRSAELSDAGPASASSAAARASTTAARPATRPESSEPPTPRFAPRPTEPSEPQTTRASAPPRAPIEPRGRQSTPVVTESRERQAPPAVTEPPRRRDPWPRIAAVVTLIGAVVGIAVVVTLTNDDAADVPTPESAAAVTPAATVAKTATPTATPAKATRTISGDGFVYTVPSTEGWTLSPAQKGQLAVRRLTGPDGELIRIVHSPGVRAEPLASAVIGETGFAVPAVPDARKVVLDHFPSDRCQATRCDDYVLNDAAFGGLAILASDSGGKASRAAAKIARSVTTG